MPTADVNVITEVLHYLKIKYRPGSKMFTAVMLSRAYLTDSIPKPEKTTNCFKCNRKKQLFQDIEKLYQAQYLCMQQTTQTQIKQAIAKDQ